PPFRRDPGWSGGGTSASGRAPPIRSPGPPGRPPRADRSRASPLSPYGPRSHPSSHPTVRRSRGLRQESPRRAPSPPRRDAMPAAIPERLRYGSASPASPVDELGDGGDRADDHERAERADGHAEQRGGAVVVIEAGPVQHGEARQPEHYRGGEGDGGEAVQGRAEEQAPAGPRRRVADLRLGADE